MISTRPLAPFLRRFDPRGGMDVPGQFDLEVGIYKICFEATVDSGTRQILGYELQDFYQWSQTSQNYR